MARFTTSLGVQVPEGADSNNVPQDLGYVADYLDANPGVSRLTQSQINALAAPAKPAGRVVYNTTTGQLQVSNGSTFSDVAAAGIALASTAPTTIVPDAAGAVGVGTTAARSDHTHAIVAAAAVTQQAGGTNAEGSSSSFARADHTHEMPVAAPATITPTGASAQGASTSFARADHVHAIGTAAPVAGGAAAAEGSSSSFARADHVHPPVPTAGIADAAVTTAKIASGVGLTEPDVTRGLLRAPQELVSVQAGGMGATVNLDASTDGVLLYLGNATANSTLNIRGDGTTTLSSLLAVGESITVALLVTNGATAYRPTVFQIDGVTVTPKWAGGTAPAAGNANSVDAYQLTIVKTAAAPTYTVLASAGRYA